MSRLILMLEDVTILILSINCFLMLIHSLLDLLELNFTYLLDLNSTELEA